MDSLVILTFWFILEKFKQYNVILPNKGEDGDVGEELDSVVYFGAVKLK